MFAHRTLDTGVRIGFSYKCGEVDTGLTALNRSQASRWLSAHRNPSSFYLVGLRGVILISSSHIPIKIGGCITREEKNG